MARVPVAIIGAACRLPGASTPGELWARVREGRPALGPVPPGRWARAHADYQGGFLADVEHFDADRFGISDREAAGIDPQQRLLLTVADEALARSPALETREVGVFVASGQLAYQEAVLGALAAAPKETLAGNVLSMLASRIAHTFDLRGPAFTIDSACSGSLVAIHQACRALADGDCEAAIVGGVNLNLTPLVHQMFERAGALSASGTLRPFTRGGDGTLPADGVVVLVLEPLARAIERGHVPWAVIEGSAVNNCGTTIGVMTPGPEGQVAVMRRALAAAGVESAAIARVEAHATGTEIGDAVEKRSIDAVYTHGPALGAVKAIVGHGMGSTGCASVLAAMGALAPGERAGVNGFAFGGTNAHVIVRGGSVPDAERTRVAGALAGRPYRVGTSDGGMLAGWVHAVGADGELKALRGERRDLLLRKGGYVITGATGGIGRVLARFLARNYRARLVLVGRRDAQWSEVEALGSVVTYVRADLGVAEDRARVVAEARAALGAVDGLFHAAGVLGLEGAEDPARVKGEALADLEGLGARLTVLFSSIAGVIPGLGKGIEAYVTANRALDAYAREQRARGREVVSIAWAPWAEVGMAATRAEAYRARGIEPIRPALGMAALVRAIAEGVAQVAVVWRGVEDDRREAEDAQIADMDAHGEATSAHSAARRPHGDAMENPSAGVTMDDDAMSTQPAATRTQGTALPPHRTPVPATSSTPAPADAVNAAAVGTRPPWRDVLRTIIARVTDIPPAAMGDDQHLTALGIDSLAAIDVVKAIETHAGRALPTTLLFENDTIAKLAAALERDDIETAHGRPERGAPAPPAARPAGAHELAHPRGPASTTPPTDTLDLLDAQRTFLIQQQYFPALPCSVMLACSVRTDARPTPLDRPTLDLALDILVDRHTVLASRVARRDDRWLQVPGPRPHVEWRSAIDDTAIANAILDLERGPLVRVVTDGHRVVVQAHHLLVDAWSTKLIMEGLLGLHEELLAGGTPSRAPAPETWWTAAPRLAAAPGALDERWRARFVDGVPPINLPYDAPAEPTGPGHMVRVELPAELTGQLEALARRHAVSMPALVLASYAELLFDVSGQHDVTVRVAHGRREARIDGINGIVGCFADSFPARAKVALPSPTDEVPTLITLARAYARELAAAQDGGGASSLALAALADRAGSGPQGLTPAGFSYLGLPTVARIGALTVGDVAGGSASGFTRLALIAWVFEGRLTLSYGFLAGFFQRATVEGFAARQRAILERALAVPAPRPERLDLRLVAALQRWPQRALTPSLGYGQLDQASAALAREVHAVGARRVAVLAEPSDAALVAVIAVLRAGAAYVPLDPAWPDARVSEVMRAAEAPHLVTVAALEARARALGAASVILADPTAVDDGPPLVVPDPSPEAYVMFTSGSTGGPKGVRVSHRVALVFLEWVERLLGVRESDRFVQTSSLAFGGSIRQMYMPILAGASLVIPDGPTKRDPTRLLGLLREHRVTIYNSVPSMWSFLMDAIEHEGSAAVASLRWVLLGGEAVPAALVRRWQRLVPAAPRGPRVINLWGSTETIVNATWFEITGALPEDEGITRVGWPRYGLEAVILDAADGVGELAVAGALADGYTGDQPGFEQHPVHGHLYRTGDRGRRHRSGALVFVGRADGQVQIYGNRVELAEIEAALCAFPGVDAAVVRYEDGRLSATLEVRRGTLPGAEAVRAFVGARLPGYMVPHEVRCERVIARTGVGKTERRSVGSELGEAAPRTPMAPGYAPHRDEAQRAANAPSTTAAPPYGSTAGRSTIAASEVPVEPHGAGPAAPAAAAVVIELWRTLLRTDDVDPTVGFFTHGGDSMMAIELVTRLRERLGVQVSPLWIHQHPTLGELVREIERRGPVPVVAAPAPPARPVARPFVPLTTALSPVQRGFWLASTEDGRGPIMVITVTVRGALDLESLQAGVRWIQLRHPILRSTFDGPRARPVQHVGAAEPAVLEIEDLSATPERLASRLDEARDARFPLGRGPLFRLKLLRLGPREHVLVAFGHHILLDAHSVWILLGELLERHGRRELGEPEPELGFFEQPPAPEIVDPYWASALEAAPATTAPLLSSGHLARVQLPASALDALATEAQRHHTTVFGLVFGAYARAVQEELGTDDVVIATAISGREHDPRGLAPVVGPFGRGIPVRVRSRLLAEVQASLRSALAHGESAGPSLLAALGTEAALRLGRFFITWLEPPTGPSGLPGGALELDWPAADLRFDTASTATEVSLAVVAQRGLTLHLRGGPLAERLAARLERALSPPASALIVYAPADVELPIRAPTRVETVRTAFGDTELILLPLTARDLGDGARLRAELRAALDATRAGTVALAGMLPSLTGLGRTPLGGRSAILTTGHAATVVSMARTVALALARRGLGWSEARVGVLGFGAIGRATLELCVATSGPPRALVIADPRFGTRAESLLGCDVIIAATSGGRALDVERLAPGTVVVDDSFPRAFDDDAAWRRMDAQGDVVLVGGGMWDMGPLVRESPFPQAEAVRRAWPVAWLPGCQAEALLVARSPELGPTVGEVDLRRALEVARAIDALGWQVAPLHLGPRAL